MKIKSLICVCTFIFFCMLNFLYAETVDRIVAVVNGDIITQSQLDKETKRYIKDIELSGESEIKKRQLIDDIIKDALDSLIDQTLTRQEALKYHIDISDEAVEEAVRKITENEKISPETFKVLLRQKGLDYDEYRGNVRKQLLQARVINAAVQSKVVITDEDIKKIYEENKKKFISQINVHLKNILAGDREKIEKIKKRLDSDGNFEVLARLYSSAPNAREGGDLGIFNISSFSDDVQKGIASLKKGEYTDVIETPQGYQIFYIADIIEKKAQSLEDVKAKIYESLYRKRIEEQFKIWLENLKKNAYIKNLL